MTNANAGTCPKCGRDVTKFPCLDHQVILPKVISLDEQIASVKREIAMRQRVYPAWVRAKRMTQEKADHEIAAMQAVLTTLEGIERNAR